MTPSITYTIQADLDRDGTYGSAIADITRFVKGQISFQYGIQQPYDEVSQPARMTFTLTNVGGEFDRDRIGTERVTNGGFDNWTGNVPDGWTVANTSVNALIRQCGADETIYPLGSYSGTGACGIFSTSSFLTDPTLSQSGVFDSNKTYRVVVPITALKKSDPNTFGTMGIKVLTNGGIQVGPLLSVANNHVFYTYISQGQSQLQLTPIERPNQYAYVEVTIDNVSVKEVPLYRQLDKSTLVRLRATYLGTTVTVWEGKITDLAFVPGPNAEPTLTITAEDAMLQLLDKEFTPALETSVTADTVLSNMFNKGDLFAYPYAKGYWMLGVEGSSELGVTTYLLANAPTSFETGVHTFPYAGDAADRGQGINAQQYIRDVIAAEVGRFIWDVRNAQFVMHNRRHDTLNDASQVKATFSDSDLDSVSYVYGDDILNQLTVEYTARTVGAANSVIWSAPGLPILLKNNGTRKMTARYFDATDNTLKIGATGFVQIQNGTDITANTANDSSGTDMSSKITMTVDFGATGATIYLSNNSGQDAYITALQLRGTPLTQKQQTYDARDGDSKRNYDEYPKTLSLPLMDDADDVKNYADYQIARFKTPFARLASITFTSLRNANTLSAAINRVIGDRITVTLTNGHDADYFIVGESRTITVGGDMPSQVTWTLEPAQRKLFWVLGVAGQSEIGMTTILGF